MYDDYLEDLPFSREEKTKIANLGAPNAAALLAMIQAAPEVFDCYLGRDSRALVRTLRHMISESERAVLDAPVQRFHATGAVVDQKPPVLQPPQYDIAERDRLFDQLQHLRQQGDSLPATKQRIAELERQLSTMLKGP